MAAATGAVDVLLAVEQLVGRMPLVVSGGFMPPSILAVVLCRTGLAEQLGRVGRLATVRAARSCLVAAR